MTKKTPTVRLRQAATALGALTLGSLTWALTEARTPILRVYELPLLPAGCKPIRLLHLSDLHMTPRRNWLIHFVQRTIDTHPDLVISTGDNFSDINALPAIEAAYEPLESLPGAFVFGSNDYYSPRPKFPLRYLFRSSKPPKRERDLPTQELREFLSRNWIELTNTTGKITLPGKGPAGRDLEIALIGVDDPHIKRDRVPQLPADWQQADLHIGVAHAPYTRILDAYANANCALTLCGHTHGGQVCLPGYGPLVTNCDQPTERAGGIFTWPPHATPRDVEANNVDANNTETSASAPSPMTVHVSRGLGTNKYTPIRLACPPEAALLVLTPNNNDA